MRRVLRHNSQAIWLPGMGCLESIKNARLRDALIYNLRNSLKNFVRSLEVRPKMSNCYRNPALRFPSLKCLDKTIKILIEKAP